MKENIVKAWYWYDIGWKVCEGYTNIQKWKIPKHRWITYWIV